MTKTELINKLAEETDLTNTDAAKALNATLNTIVDIVKCGNKVTIVGFGTFRTAERKAKEGRNPRTGETITIPAMKTPKFVAGKMFKEAVK